MKANVKFHNWINEYRFKIVPEEFEINYYYDVKATPQKYLKYMIFMNIELEKIEGKMYQFFPLQSSIIPNHIQIDTKSVIELLVDKGKKEYLTKSRIDFNEMQSSGRQISPTIIQFLEGSFTVQHRTDVAQMLPNLPHATQRSKAASNGYKRRFEDRA